MLKNWLVSSFRFLIKDRVYSAINLGGIALGLAVVLIMGLYVTDEFGYDRQWPDAENTYLIAYDEPRPDGSFERCGIVGGGMVKALTEQFPEVTASARVQSIGPLAIRSLGLDNGWSENGVQLRVMRAEPTLFSLFPHRVLRGDSTTMLSTEQSVVLTESAARKLFGNDNPIGRQVALDPARPYNVAAVIEDGPRKSHMQYDMLLPLIDSPQRWYFANFESWAVSGYCHVRPGTDLRKLEQGIDKLVDENTEIQEAKAHLVPVRDLHLNASGYFGFFVNIDPGDSRQVVLLAIIAGVILLIAAFNYINLTTARAMTRARDVGLRKTVGATRQMLILHYIGESVMLVLISLVLALVIGELVMPLASEVLGKDLSRISLLQPGTLGIILVLTLVIGTLAGIYPGLVLSSFSPLHALQSQKVLSNSRGSLRRVIITLQFSAAVVLLITVMVIRSQLSFLSRMDMGYQRENVVLVSLDQVDARQAILDRLRSNKTIIEASTSNAWPGQDASESYIALEGWSQDDLKNMSFKKMYIGDGWFDLMGVQLLDGRSFREGSQEDATNSVILNETAAKLSGWENPIGKWVQFFEDDKKYVVGVVKDFQFGSGRIAVPPVAIGYDPQAVTGDLALFVKLAANQTVEGINAVKAAFNEYANGKPFNYSFLDERFNRLYKRDRVFARNVALSSGLAIFISALGLFGLTAFTTERRRREVAVRKVLGASESGLVVMLSREMLQRVALANVIAWPVAWWLMSRWMTSFVYRQSMPIWPFLFSALLVLAFAGLVIASLVIGIARSNPATSLRSE